MIKITIDVNKNQIKDLSTKLLGIDNFVKNGLIQAMLYAESEAKQSFGRQGNLKSRSGRLRNSITNKVEGFTGWLGTNVKYAAIHEFGGVIKPKKGKYLKFQVKKQWKTVKQSIIPARPFIAPAIHNNIEKFTDIILQEIMRGLE